MKKLILTVAVACAIALAACGPKGPTGDIKADAKYLVEQCVKAQEDGKDDQAKQLTEEYMNYYREKGTSQAAEFAFTVLGEMGNLPAEQQKALIGIQ
ncbi:MAG: hypothetical protein K2L74_08155 [Muribaculaceae bacterium]|nr:hypothetical protein [Muribaculaceae bacterium]MDE6541971.1 hypothetical protein [Muribaculaceae bacterium]